MLTAEDCLDQIIVPRLIAAKADLDRVHFLKCIRKDNKDRMFLLGKDLEMPRQAKDRGRHLQRSEDGWQMVLGTSAARPARGGHAVSPLTISDRSLRTLRTDQWGYGRSLRRSLRKNTKGALPSKGAPEVCSLSY